MINAKGKNLNVLWLHVTKNFNSQSESCLCSWNKVQPFQSLMNSASVLHSISGFYLWEMAWEFKSIGKHFYSLLNVQIALSQFSVQARLRCRHRFRWCVCVRILTFL